MLRIVLGLKDAYLGDASLLPRGRAAGEALQPRVEVADPVFDVQYEHRQSVSDAERELAADMAAMATAEAAADYPERTRLHTRFDYSTQEWIFTTDSPAPEGVSGDEAEPASCQLSLWVISAEANPKVVQRMLGHASAAMTLDVYADLFDSDLASVAENVATAGQLAHLLDTENASTSIARSEGVVPSVGFEPTLDGF